MGLQNILSNSEIRFKKKNQAFSNDYLDIEIKIYFNSLC